MKRVHLVGLLFLVLAAMMLTARTEAGTVKEVNVLMFSEEARYHEALRGVKEQLARKGFPEGSVRYVVCNAEGDKGKAAAFVRRFAAEKPDLIVTIGTSATIAVSREIKDVPIIFAMVYNPVEANVVQSWEHPGGYATGASPWVPMDKLVGTLQKFAAVKRIAVLYTPAEKNSESQLKELQRLQSRTKIKVIPVPLSTGDDIPVLLPQVVRSVDAVYLSGSSVVGHNLPAIVAYATKAKVVTVSHLEDMVEKGALLGLIADPHTVGKLAGDKAARVLKGAPPASIPVEHLKTFDVILNRQTAEAGGFQLPQPFLKLVTRTIR